jgi:hypothetical protein
VISEKNLFEFLIAIISSDPPVQNNMISEFRDKDKCFLFLGFGFRNWYLRILLYVLLCGGKGSYSEKVSRSFAFESILLDNSNFQQVCFVFRDNLKVDFPELTVEKFVVELNDRFEKTLKEPENIRIAKTIAENAPKVFICHASEDKETAMYLYNKLKEEGLDPWIDQEGIIVADDWNQLINKKIRDSDYVIILQSKAMASKTRGYVNKEIKIALEIQKEVRDPYKFIFPVKIDDGDVLEELNDKQWIDLRDPAKYDELVKEIRRDQQRRKK